MIDLYWKITRKNKLGAYLHAELFVGCCATPIASIWRSDRGKQWTHLINVPIEGEVREWLPFDEKKLVVEEAVHTWLDIATTPRAVMEYTP